MYGNNYFHITFRNEFIGKFFFKTKIITYFKVKFDIIIRNAIKYIELV